MFLLLQLLLFFLLAIGILSFISNKWIKLTLSLIFGFFFGLQAVSAYMGDSVIDLKFTVHFNLNDISIVAGEFIVEGILFILLIIGAIYAMYKLSTFLSKKVKPLLTIPIALGCILFLTLPKTSMFNTLSQIVKMKLLKEKEFHQAWQDLGIPKEDYVAPNEVEATKGKNVIILSLESLENGYLQDNLPDLCPNLSELKKTNTYYVMNRGPGSDWTCASLYTYLTGFPMYFSAYGNDVFQSSKGTCLPGISHVFDAAGYEQFYLMGNTTHAGVDDLLRTFNIPFYPQSYYNERFGEESWGVHDLNIFEVAKEKVKELKTTEKPYVLYLSTISTHYPDGVYDARMEKYISKKDTELEFMAAATDYLIADFLDYLKQNNLLENTIFYIFPDHLLMGNGSSVLDKFDKRQLYLITNASQEKIGIPLDQRINQIDLGKIILDGADIQHNVRFLTEYVGNTPLQFIEDYKDEILQLNEASLKKGYAH